MGYQKSRGTVLGETVCRRSTPLTASLPTLTIELQCKVKSSRQVIMEVIGEKVTSVSISGGNGSPLFSFWMSLVIMGLCDLLST